MFLWLTHLGGFFDPLPGSTRGAARNYDTLSLEEICSFPQPPMEDDAMLLLWRVSSMVEEAYSVVRDWGFEPKSEIIWRKISSTGQKIHFGMGRYTRMAHESCIIATRGRFKVRSRSVRSVFSARVGKHSAKPEAFYDLVEELADGPYVEIFGRRQREGWTVLGNQPDLRERVRALTLFGHDGSPT